MATEFSSLTSTLCFERLEFRQKDFSTENFLIKARRRGNSFERIRDDLRVLLKIVQNSMIELINKDYADFVNLSSNLAGLRGVVDKLNADVVELVQDFNQVSSKIRESVQILNEKYQERHFLKLEKQSIFTKSAQFYKLNRLKPLLIALNVDSPVLSDSKLDRLNRLLVDFLAAHSNKNKNGDTKEDFDQLEKDFNACIAVYQSVLEKLFIDEVKNSGLENVVSSRAKQNISKILTSFACCERLEAAHACFLNEFVAVECRKIFKTTKKPSESQQVAELQALLNLLVTVRRQYAPLFEQFEPKNFINDCLLTCLLNYFDERFTNLLFSTDAMEFRRSYKILCKFFKEWKNLDDNSTKSDTSYYLIRLIFSKFNVHVYYQLRKKEILDYVNDAFDLKSRSIPLVENLQNNEFFAKTTCRIYEAVSTIWRDDEVSSENSSAVILPPLISKCVELTLLLLNRYERFLFDQNALFDKSSSPSSRNPDQQLGAKLGKVPSRTGLTESDSGLNDPDGYFTLIYFVGDLHMLQHKLGGLIADYAGSASKRILDDAVRHLGAKIEPILLKTFAENLISKMVARLSAVSEIPRRYRWTRKDAPDQPSSYVRNAFDVLQAFLGAAPKCRLSDEIVESILSTVFRSVIETFENEVKGVVNSVDKISSSLNKLKKSGKSSGFAGGSASNDVISSSTVDKSGISISDDEKIRMQLRLDVEEFVNLLNNVHNNKDSPCETSVLESLVQFPKNDAAV